MPYILKAEKLESQSNKVTELNEKVTDEQYPSAKAVYEAIQNGSGGSATNIDVDQTYNPISTNAQSGKAVAEALHVKNTASGSTIQVNDVSPIEHNLKVGVRSKNLIPFPYQCEIGKEYPHNGVTFTVNSDGSIKVDGTANENATFYLVSGQKLSSLIAGEVYTPSISGASNHNVILMCNYEDKNGVPKAFTTTQMGTKVYPDDVGTDKIYLLVSKGNEVHTTVYPQLELGDTVTEYTPYINIANTDNRDGNLIPYPFHSTTAQGGTYKENDITFTDNGDGSITINGTAKENTYFGFITYAQTQVEQLYLYKGQSYTLDILPVIGSYQSIYAYVTESNGTQHFEVGDSITFTATQDGYVSCGFVVHKDYKAENITIRPHLEAYTPKVSRCGKNLFDKSKVESGITETETGFSFTKTTGEYGDGSPVTIGKLRNLAPLVKAGDVVTFSANPTQTEWVYGNLYLAGSKTNFTRNSTIIIQEADLDANVYAYGELGELQEYKNFILSYSLTETKTETEYEPYIEPQTATANEHGIVEGLKSVSPNMVVMTDTEGVIIDCEYLNKNYTEERYNIQLHTDQIFDSNSKNAQSGIAVAEAIEEINRRAPLFIPTMVKLPVTADKVTTNYANSFNINLFNRTPMINETFYVDVISNDGITFSIGAKITDDDATYSDGFASFKIIEIMQINKSVDNHNDDKSAHNDMRISINDLKERLDNIIDVEDGTIDEVAMHNTNDSAHADIRANINNLEDRLDNIKMPTKTSDLENDTNFSAIGQSTEQGGEIFNDYNNNFAGSKAFTVLAINANTKTYTLDSTEGLSVGDEFSVHLVQGDGSLQCDNSGKITAISGSTVTVDRIFNNSSFDISKFHTRESYLDADGNDTEINTFRIPAKPMVGTRDIGVYASAENKDTKALSKGSHAEGKGSVAAGSWSHAEGNNTYAAYSAHSEGSGTKAIGQNSHAEGQNTQATSFGTHAEGYQSQATDNAAHAEGFATQAKGKYSHAEGSHGIASGEGAHVEGIGSDTLDDSGQYKYGAFGKGSHAEGSYTNAQGNSAHAEGYQASALGETSHAEGRNTTAAGVSSHAEGFNTTAKGDYSHVEGWWSDTQGLYSHAEGQASHATGQASHAEGKNCKATGNFSHAEGDYTEANGTCSHASGDHTIAGYYGQTVVGRYNKNKENTLFEVGNGERYEVNEMGDWATLRQNAFEAYKDGHAELPSLRNSDGELDAAAIGTSDFSVATKGYIDGEINSVKKYSDNKINTTKNALLGKSTDSKTSTTIYGVQNYIKDVDNKIKCYASEDDIPSDLPEGTLIFIYGE